MPCSASPEAGHDPSLSQGDQSVDVAIKAPAKILHLAGNQEPESLAEPWSESVLRKPGRGDLAIIGELRIYDPMVLRGSNFLKIQVWSRRRFWNEDFEMLWAKRADNLNQRRGY